jgi:hypothetical protein
MGAAHNTHNGNVYGHVLRVLLLALVSLLLSTSVAFAAGPPRMGTGEFEVKIKGLTQTSAGPFFNEIEPNEVATKWEYDYAQSESGHAPAEGSSAWLPVPDGTGTTPAVQTSEIETEGLTGLLPETTYYIRLKASNSAGALVLRSGTTSPLITPFETAPLHPRVGGIEVGNVALDSAGISGAVVPDNYETHWRFEYETSLSKLENKEGFVGPEGTIAAAEADEEFHHVAGELVNLEKGTKYYVRLFAENQHGGVTSSTLQFETAGPPVAFTAPIHAFHGEVIRALGEIRPDGLDTHYHAEFVRQEQFAANGFAEATSTPDLDVGPGSSHAEEVDNHEVVVFDSIPVGDDLPGLQVGVTYRYRIVAVNASGKPVDGNEQIITVPIPGPIGEPTCPNGGLRIGPSAGLPDCRAYEQVTPAEKEGAQDIFNYSSQGQDPAVVGEDGNHMMLRAAGVQWGQNTDASVSDYFFTHAAGGWQMTATTPQPEAGINSYRPTVFTPDLTSVGLEVEWGTVAHHTESEQIEFKVGNPGGPYTVVASVPRADRELSTGEGWVSASALDSKFVMQVKDHNLAGFTGTLSGSDLYEWSAGTLRQVNTGIGSCGAQIALAGKGAISTDGSRVLFEAVPGNECAKPKHSYIRVNGGTPSARTVDVGEYHVLAADHEGSELLLERQTGGVYEFFLHDSESTSPKRLFSTNESVQPEVSGEFTVIYFVSHERLSEDTPSSFSVGGGPGSGYLYQYDLSTDTLHFLVETASNESEGTPSITPNGQDYYWSSVEVAGIPGGGHLPGGILPTSKTFVADGGPTLQRYRYDSAENAVECLSCASLYNPEPHESADGSSGQGAISENGDYAIFDTAAALVPSDVDGEHPLSLEPGGLGVEDPAADFEYSVSSDVYEWRKNGVYGCSHVQGCIALISSGIGGLRNAPVGITPSGSDVFFTTHYPLVTQDTDIAGDVYDARIGGGFAPPSPPPPECAGDACQSPVMAPIDTTPASLSFSGPGSRVIPTKVKAKPRMKPCKKGYVRSKGKCVRRRTKRVRARKVATRPIKHTEGGRR